MRYDDMQDDVMIDFNARDTDLSSWPRDRLDRATLAAQADAVGGLPTPTVRDYGTEPAARARRSWQARHRYISDTYDDDASAPGPDAYTADEKRSRAVTLRRLLRCAVILIAGAAVYALISSFT